MNTGRYIFSQVTDFIPRYEFDKCVARYFGDYHFTCYNQFLYLLFGQLTACQSMRDVCLCLLFPFILLFHSCIFTALGCDAPQKTEMFIDFLLYFVVSFA